MADKHENEREQPESAAESTLNREFAGVLGSILESASAEVAATEEFDIGFSVALVGEAGKDELAGLLSELPVVATIVLDEEIGGKAALLTDMATASALSELVSAEGLAAKDTPIEDNLSSLHDILNPIVDALGKACEC